MEHKYDGMFLSNATKNISHNMDESQAKLHSVKEAAFQRLYVIFLYKYSVFNAKTWIFLELKVEKDEYKESHEKLWEVGSKFKAIYAPKNEF